MQPDSSPVPCGRFIQAATAVAPSLGCRTGETAGPAILDLHREARSIASPRPEGCGVRAVPSSNALRGVLALVTAPATAANDDILAAIVGCLTKATEAETPSPNVVDQLTAALTTHVAERYVRRQSPSAPASGGLPPWKLRLACETLCAHIDGSVSIRELAEKCKLSRAHFARAFTRSTGLAPHRWRMRQRVEAAKGMMRNPRLSLVEVAMACGFCDQSALTRAFSAVEGIPPGRWRRAYVGPTQPADDPS